MCLGSRHSYSDSIRSVVCCSCLSGSVCESVSGLGGGILTAIQYGLLSVVHVCQGLSVRLCESREQAFLHGSDRVMLSVVHVCHVCL